MGDDGWEVRAGSQGRKVKASIAVFSVCDKLAESIGQARTIIRNSLASYAVLLMSLQGIMGSELIISIFLWFEAAYL